MAQENNSDFLMQQQRAVERMLEMRGRATAGTPRHTMPPAPSFVRMPAQRDRQSNTPNASAPQPEQRDSTAAQTNSAEHIASALMSANRQSMRPSDKHENSILERIRTERDLPLILGLLLILWSENADRKLLLALLYIMM